MTNKIDFTKLSKPISDALDTDYMDIYRQIEGSPKRDLLYSNVPCHIAIKSSDNADPSSVDTQPIITSLRIHCPNYDGAGYLKNNDYLVVKKCDLNGNILNYYEGIIGEPATSMARQFVDMVMSSDKKSEEPEPAPPPEDETIDISINYLDNSTNEKIKDSVIQKAQIGKNITIKPLSIENYVIARSVLNGEEVTSGDIVIDEVENIDYNIDFYYNSVVIMTYIRPLVYGDFIKNNGTYSYGNHLYAKIPILEVIGNNSIKIASNKFKHNEIGVITLDTTNIQNKTTNKFIDNLGNWHIITFADTEPVEAYVTEWYD